MGRCPIDQLRDELEPDSDIRLRRHKAIRTLDAPTAGLDLTYGDYDSNGNIGSIYDAVDQQRQCFSYDDLYRLTAAYTTTQSGCGGYVSGGPNPYTQTYSYNTIGNILTRSDVANGATYTYGEDGPGRMLSPRSDPGTRSAMTTVAT